MTDGQKIEAVLSYCVFEFDANRQEMLDILSYSVDGMSVTSNCGMDTYHTVFTLDKNLNVIDCQQIDERA